MDGFYVLDVFARLVGVLLLFLGAALAARRWMGLQPAQRVRQLKVVESIHLAPRQALHLVRAGEQYFLVGATDASIALVSPVEIEEAALETEAPSAALSIPALPGMVKFQQILGTYIKTGGKQ